MNSEEKRELKSKLKEGEYLSLQTVPCPWQDEGFDPLPINSIYRVKNEPKTVSQFVACYGGEEELLKAARAYSIYHKWNPEAREVNYKENWKEKVDQWASAHLSTENGRPKLVPNREEAIKAWQALVKKASKIIKEIEISHPTSQGRLAQSHIDWAKEIWSDDASREAFIKLAAAKGVEIHSEMGLAWFRRNHL